jgi:hypothetical protein
LLAAPLRILPIGGVVFPEKSWLSPWAQLHVTFQFVPIVTDDPSFAAKGKGHDKSAFFLRGKYISLISQNKNERNSSAAGSLPLVNLLMNICLLLTS